MKPQRQVHPKTVGRPCRNCGGTERYGGRGSNCIRCTNTRSKQRKLTAAYKAQAKRYWMAKRYGLTPEGMDALFAQQGSRCACCGATEPGSQRGWVIDHCHKTGSIRGILCDACNVGLGRFDDSIDKLNLAITYLERALEVTHA